MDEGPGGDDDSIDEEGLFDAVFENVAEEHDAHIGCEEAAEREKHNKTHLPHRPWCAVCVQARAREDKHYAAVRAERESGSAELAMD